MGITATSAANANRTTDIAMAANGTGAGVISPRKLRAQIREPTPIPTEKIARKKLVRVSVPPSTSLASGGRSASTIAPNVQNQEMPRMQDQIVGCSRASRSSDRVSAMTFNVTDWSGSAVGAGGMKRAAV